MMAKAKSPRRPLSAKTCQQITELMVDYLTDKLRPSVKQEFAKHLSVCPDCVSFVNTYKKTISTASSLSRVNMPAKVRNNVLEFLRKKLRRISAVVFYLITQLAA
jgi:anti-sigma factor RsiW